MGSLLSSFLLVCGLVFVVIGYNHSDGYDLRTFISKLLTELAVIFYSEAFFIAALVVILSIYLLYYCLVAGVSLLMLLGIKNREPRKLLPFLILMGIGIFLSFLQLMVSSLVTGLISAFISISLNVYLLLVIYSLYVVFKNERSNNAGKNNPTQLYVFPQQTGVHSYAAESTPVQENPNQQSLLVAQP